MRAILAERAGIDVDDLRVRARRRIVATRLDQLVVGGATGVALAVAITAGPQLGFGIERLLSFVLAGAAMVAMVRRPLLALKVAVVVVPSSVFLLSWLLTFGMPPAIVRSGALLKDAVVVAVLIGGYRAHRERGTALGPLDRAGLAYLGLAGAWYVLTPLIAAESVTGDARLIAVRQLVLFPAMFLGVRWLAPTAAERRRVLRWMLGAAAAIALAGVYQRLQPVAFRDFLLEDADVDRYYREVAGLSGKPLSRQLDWLFVEPLRVVSVLMAPFAFADMMLTAFAAAAAALARGRARRAAIALAGLFALAVVWSGTRINMIALAVVVGALLLDGRGVPERTRVQVVAVGLVAVLAFAPTVLGSRIAGDENEVSNEGHRNELTTAMGKIVDNPLGAGLGAEGAVQRRLQGNADTISGNTVLAIGVQGGVLTMAAFLAFLVATLRELETRRRRNPHDELLRMSYLTLLGGIVAVSTHQGWLDLTSGTFVWTAIGLGLPEVVET